MVSHPQLHSRSGGCALIVLILVLGHQQRICAIGTFNIVMHPGTSLAANGPALAALNRAADAWKAHIADPIVIHINSNFGSLESGTLGTALSGTVVPRYSDVRTA